MTNSNVDVERFDRQIRLYGMDGQIKISECDVLVYKTGIEGSEMIKNLVLAGIRSCSIFENSAGLFHKNNQFEINRVQRLNPSCRINLVDNIDGSFQIIVYGSSKHEKLLYKKEAALYVCVEQFGMVGWYKLSSTTETFNWSIDGKTLNEKQFARTVGVTWPIVYCFILGKCNFKDINEQLKKWNIKIDKDYIELLIESKSRHEIGLASILSGFAAREILQFVSKGNANLGSFVVDGFNMKVKKIK
eukprot:NODE_404_length_8016_cov_1.092965.p5 type:complete len:246 gc:universal NODE_404_length_8016_cov_1.092965:7039-6302(-)